ncbi:hypothetical protein D3C71_1889190 [compost metagenome]
MHDKGNRQRFQHGDARIVGAHIGKEQRIDIAAGRQPLESCLFILRRAGIEHEMEVVLDRLFAKPGQELAEMHVGIDAGGDRHDHAD